MKNTKGIKFRQQYDVPQSQQTLLSKFMLKLKNPGIPYQMQIAGDKVFIKVPKEKHHWWSPELLLTIEKSENDTSTVKEVIGPNPPVFMLSMFLITGGGVISLFALIVAISQLGLGMASQLSFIISIVALILIVATLLFMALGRKKARPHMEELRKFAGETMDAE